MTGTNFESDDDAPLPSQSHPPLATALFGGIGTVILGVLAVVALFGYGVFKVIQKKLSGSKIGSPCKFTPFGSVYRLFQHSFPTS